MHTSCTTCAVRGHACRLTRFCVLCLCVAGRARQAGLENKSVLPAIADLYVEERLAGSLRTASYGPEKCALWPMVFGSLESVGVLGCMVSFSLKKCVYVHRKGIFFLWLAPSARGDGLHRGGRAQKSAAIFVITSFLRKTV